MKFLNSTRTRAGLLVVACALVGGTGCITMSLVQQAQYRNQQAEREKFRQQHEAQYASRARAGETSAMVSLALAMTARDNPANVDLGAALVWLERAAQAGNAQAQVLLGGALSSGIWNIGTYARLPQGSSERPRGIFLLQQAAVQACVIAVPDAGRFDPAERAGHYLDLAGRHDEALLWRARSVVHCGVPAADMLAARASSPGTQAAQDRREALALLMLTGDRVRIEQARAAIAPDDAAAAESLAADLPRRIAASERQYPAPPRKEIP